jgi:hypothetical protein
MRKLTRYGKRKASNTGNKSEKSALDIGLQRAVWMVQVLLFPLAIIGYIFTVRPVYQKQLLDEQIAERTVLLRQVSNSVEKLQSEQARLSTENATLAKDAAFAYNSLRNNLVRTLPSIAVNCAYGPELINGKLFTCVQKAVGLDIAPLRNKTRLVCNCS